MELGPIGKWLRTLALGLLDTTSPCEPAGHQVEILVRAASAGRAAERPRTWPEESGKSGSHSVGVYDSRRTGKIHGLWRQQKQRLAELTVKQRVHLHWYYKVIFTCRLHHKLSHNYKQLQVVIWGFPIIFSSLLTSRTVRLSVRCEQGQCVFLSVFAALILL